MRTIQASYERFRLNKSGHNSSYGYYRGCWHPFAQPLFAVPFQNTAKVPSRRKEHLGFPYHAFAHCRVFGTAARRSARVLVSVPFWGKPLPWPLPILDLVSRYLTNCLIGHRPIVKRNAMVLTARLSQYNRFRFCCYKVLASVSRGYPLLYGTLSMCYLSRTPSTLTGRI